MSILPTTSVKGKDSTDDNEQEKKKEDEKSHLQQQRDLILDLLKHYSINTLDMNFCKHNSRERVRTSSDSFSFSSQR